VEAIVRLSWFRSAGLVQSGIPLTMLVFGRVDNSIQGGIEDRVWLHSHPVFLEESLDRIESLSPWLCFSSRLNIVHTTMVAKQYWLFQTFQGQTAKRQKPPELAESHQATDASVESR
jgi:hypothetical protein